jgi:hypothetical protein
LSESYKRAKNNLWRKFSLLNVKTVLTFKTVRPFVYCRKCDTLLYLHNISFTATTEVKGKAVPLQAWSGPEGSTKFRFPDYMTTAQDGGNVVSLTHRPPLPPENAPGTHFC